jgi:putative ABC transport system permease protein
MKPLRAGPLSAFFQAWTWQMAWRDSRTQRRRLAVFGLSVVSGIAALVAIHSLKASLEKAMATQAKALLGSDLQIASRQPFAPEALRQLEGAAVAVARETSAASMLYFPGADAARMVQIRGFEGGYPFYGRVETEPAEAWKRLQAEPGIVLEPALLDQFSVRVGDRVKLGGVELPILGTIRRPAPRSSRFSGFAPEAYVGRAELERAGLLGTSSLAFYYAHLKLAKDSDARKISREVAPMTWQTETPERRRERLGDALENFQEFLGILALVALMLGAIGVAGAVHAHVARRIPVVAVLRCLGCPGSVAFAIYLVQAAALGLLGAGIGALLGIGLHLGTLAFFQGDLPIEVEMVPIWGVVAQTTGAGFAVCCGFALLPLWRVRQVSPAETLRGGGGAPDGMKAVVRVAPIYAILAGLVLLLAWLNSPDWERALALTAGLGVAFGILAATAKGLSLLARRILNPAWPYLVRQGISNLYRPQNQTLLFLLSLGLGTFLLLTLLLARNLILERVRVVENAGGPNLYLVDVQPDQREEVEGLVRGLGLPVLESAPMVTMRLASVRGVPVSELEKDRSVRRWPLRREYRSTYRDRLNATETVIAGEWFSGRADPDGVVPVSLEQDLAGDLNVKVGDELGIDVQGVPIRARVVNLRRVDWSRFTLNFFMIFPPGVLESAPGFHVVTTRTPAGMTSGALQRALVGKFPNVTAIDLTLLLETARTILERIERVVQILAGFTALAGLAILVGTLWNGREQRIRESVLLRTLGASQRQVRAILAVEYAALGALSALTGTILAVAANVAFALFVFKASPWPDPVLLAGAFFCGTALSVLAGLGLSRGVCTHPPLEILRAET